MVRVSSFFFHSFRAGNKANGILPRKSFSNRRCEDDGINLWPHTCNYLLDFLAKVGLTTGSLQDDGLTDLAKKFNVTLEVRQ